MSIKWTESFGFRFWAWLFLPGHTIFILWVGLGFWMFSWLDDFEVAQANNHVDIILGGLTIISIGIYFLLGTYQVMFHDIRKLFIVKKLEVEGDSVTVKGYYLKEDSFSLKGIETIQIFRIEGHWYKRVHSLFYRAIDHYRLDLKDGRQFCFQGSNKTVKAMLEQLTDDEIIKELPENWDLTLK